MYLPAPPQSCFFLIVRVWPLFLLITAYGPHQDPPNFRLDREQETLITAEVGKVTGFSSNYASTGMRPKSLAHTESQLNKMIEF